MITIPFFRAGASVSHILVLLQPRTDHFLSAVGKIQRTSISRALSLLFSISFLKIAYCGSRWFRYTGLVPSRKPSIFVLFLICLESVPPANFRQFALTFSTLEMLKSLQLFQISSRVSLIFMNLLGFSQIL